jgi:DNA repair protein RecO
MAPRHLSTTGWVLSRSTSENDLRLILLTSTLGKIYATAKGAQKITSQRLGMLQPGNEVKVQLYSKGDFFWVTESKTIFHFLHHQKSLTQINLLFYFLEIVNALIPQHHSDPDTYSLVTKLIKAIETDNFYLLISSEIKLIEQLGYGPPANIVSLYSQKDLSACQQALNNYLQSIIERPLFSPQLFK